MPFLIYTLLLTQWHLIYASIVFIISIICFSALFRLFFRVFYVSMLLLVHLKSRPVDSGFLEGYLTNGSLFGQTEYPKILRFGKGQ